MKQLFYLVILGCGLLLASVKTDAAVPAPKTDSNLAAAGDTIYRKGSWTLGLEAANNSSFYGRISDKKYPYTAATLTYTHYTGLFASATTYQLFNTPGYFHETDLSLGYGFSLGKNISANVSYARFFFNKETPLVKAVTSDALNAYAGLDWKILYSAVTTSYLFGETNDIFVVLDNSRYIPLNQLWNGKTTIGLDPKISITGGTQQFAEEYVTMVTQQQQKKDEEDKKNKGLVGILNPILPGNGNGNNGNGNSSNSTTTTTTTDTTTTIKTRFNVLNYDFKLPVVIMLGNFEIEPSWRYSFPVNYFKGEASKPRSFYTISVNYSF